MSDVDLPNVLNTEKNHTRNHYMLKKPGVLGGLGLFGPCIGLNLPYL